jgi:hypothetical protein
MDRATARASCLEHPISGVPVVAAVTWKPSGIPTLRDHFLGHKKRPASIAPSGGPDGTRLSGPRYFRDSSALAVIAPRRFSPTSRVAAVESLSGRSSEPPEVGYRGATAERTTS